MLNELLYFIIVIVLCFVFINIAWDNIPKEFIQLLKKLISKYILKKDGGKKNE